MHRLTSLLLVLFTTLAVAGESRVPTPELTRGKGEQCVEPNDVMRRDHMRFLEHQRDDTVHQGIRATKHSLVGCIDCHAQRETSGEAIPVNAPGQFCESCHTYAAVKMDCFECHATVPDAKTRTGAAQ